VGIWTKRGTVCGRTISMTLVAAVSLALPAVASAQAPQDSIPSTANPVPLPPGSELSPLDRELAEKSNERELIPMEDWYKRQSAEGRLTAYGDDIMGDAIDPHTGSLSFQHTDVSIPGNFALPVSVSRKRAPGSVYHENEYAEFGDWELVAPRMKVTTAARGAGWGKTGFARCTSSYYESFPDLQIGRLDSTRLYAHEYSNGITFEAPGAGSREILYGGSQLPKVFPSTAKFVSTDHWYVSCGVNATDGGQGFKVHSPDGTVYTLNKYIKREAEPLGFMTPGSRPTPRDVIILAATRATDVHGNTVVYTYSGQKLTRILASDGRRIDLTYKSGTELIQTVTAKGDNTSENRTWTYGYAQTDYHKPQWEGLETREDHMDLVSVRQPDGKSWSLDMGGMHGTPSPGEYCDGTPSPVTLTHPYGMKGTFKLKDMRHRMSLNAQTRYMKDCPRPEGAGPPPNPTPFGITDPNWPPLVTSTTSTIAVTNKTLSGMGTTGSAWSYDYESDLGAAGTSSSDPTNTTTVTGPEGLRIVYKHAWQDGDLGGLMVEAKTYQGSKLLRTIGTEHVLGPRLGGAVSSLGPRSKIQDHAHAEKRVTVTQERDVYTTSHVYDFNTSSNTYSYGSPTTTTKAASFESTNRVTTTVYDHKKASWVLSLPKTVTQNGREMWSTDYTAAGLPTEVRKFGHLWGRFRYYTSTGYRGAVQYITDPLGQRTYAYSWKRGVPQRIRRADGSNLYQSIDGRGWQKSVTDARSNTTSYRHDKMGRLTQVNPPGHYSNTNIGFTFGNGAVQTTTRGTAKTIVTYDAMLRPTLVEQRDTSWGEPSYVKTAYDKLGRKAFVSQPSGSSNAPSGTDFTYDALGRETQRRENVSPFATVKTRFYNRNRTGVYDANNVRTLTSRRGFDGPGQGMVIRIQEPDTVGIRYTLMYPNEWDEITRVYQLGKYGSHGYENRVNHWFIYDDRGRLCRSRTPEGGDTLYQYDAADRLTAYAQGQATGSSCPTSLPASARVSLSLDQVGQVTGELFAGSATPRIDRDFDADGNLKWVTRGANRWDYAYDAVGNLTKEVSNFAFGGVAGLDHHVKTIDREYSPEGYLDFMKYPNGSKVRYNVDGRGRTRSAVFETVDQYTTVPVTLASNIAYHPDGSIASMTYGNGLTRTRTLNARQLTERDIVRKSQNQMLDRSYAYTKLGQISRITDGVNPDATQNYTYSPLGELLTASGPPEWGQGAYTYDGIGNLMTKRMLGRNLAYTYDSRNKLDYYTVDNARYEVSTDARGNVTLLDTLDSGGTKRRLGFTYDLANQPVRVTGSGQGTSNYAYDGNRKRLRSHQTVSTWSGASSGEGDAKFNFYGLDGSLLGAHHIRGHAFNFKTTQKSGLSPLGDFQGGLILDGGFGATSEFTDPKNQRLHSTIIDYVKLGGQALVRIERENDLVPGTTQQTPRVFTYQHPDQLGTSVAQSKGTGHNNQTSGAGSGVKMCEEIYTPFGEISRPSTCSKDRPGYTGHLRDTDTGLNYMQARFQSPLIGRFLSIDPVTFMDTGDPNFFNRYTYAFNDPINVIDPTGMAGCSDTGSQGLSGTCYDSSNFRTEDKKGFLGTKKANDFSNDAVGTASTDAAASDFANSTNQTTGNEQVSRIDTNPDGTSSTSNVPLTDSGPSHAAFKPSEVAGADGVIHTHPTDANTIVPGAGDSAVPEMGIPNYIAHGTSVIAVEISGGQVRGRVVSGKIGSDDRRGLKSRLNEFQRRGKTR